MTYHNYPEPTPEQQEQMQLETLLLKQHFEQLRQVCERMREGKTTPADTQFILTHAKDVYRHLSMLKDIEQIDKENKNANK